MIALLKHLETTQLPILLQTPEVWHTLDITYEPPRVERLWTSIGFNRIFLHVIHPCSTTPLYHPHDWPSAMKIVKGAYEMQVGAGGVPLVRIEMVAGSYYEMKEPLAYHSVLPLGRAPTKTLMLTGPKYPQPITFPKPSQVQEELSEARKLQILEEFKQDLFFIES